MPSNPDSKSSPTKQKGDANKKKSKKQTTPKRKNSLTSSVNQNNNNTSNNTKQEKANSPLQENSEQTSLVVTSPLENDQQNMDNSMPNTIYEQRKKFALKKIIAGYTKGISFLHHQKYEIAIGCFTTSLGLKQNLYVTIVKDDEEGVLDDLQNCQTQDPPFLLESTLFDDDQHRQDLHSSLGFQDISCSSSSLPLSPCTFTLYILRAIAFIGHHVYSKAVVDCDSVLRQNSSYHSAYIIKGHALICMKKYKEAYMNFTALLEQVSINSQMDSHENNYQNGRHSHKCDIDFTLLLGSKEDVFDSLRTLHGTSYHINEMSKKQNKTKSDLDALEQSVINICKYCDYYAKSIVEYEKKKCAEVFGYKPSMEEISNEMEFQNSESFTEYDEDLVDEDDFGLNILDIYCLASSPTDINCRSMGAVLLVDYIASAVNECSRAMSEDFDKIDLQNKKENKSVLEEIFKEEEERSLILNGIDSILDSLCLWDDQELKLFSTRAVTDLCSVDADCSLRRRIVQYEDGDALRQIIQQLSLIDYIIIDMGECDHQLCDLLEASVSALASIARGGSSDISRTIYEMNGLVALSPILLQVSRSLAVQKMPVVKAVYVAQCYAYLSVENFDTKEAIVSDEKTLLALYKLSLQNIDLEAKNFAIITVGNSCQNPECWGKPLLLKQISEQVYNTLISKGYLELLLEIIKKIPTNSHPQPNKTQQGIDIGLIELQYNSINTMTGLLGFESGRKRFEKNRGEEILTDIIFNSKFEALRDVSAKARTFYITLNDYGDKISEFVFTKFKKKILNVLDKNDTSEPKPIQSEPVKSIKPPQPPPSSNGNSREEIIREETMRFMEMKKKGELPNDFNEDFYSKLMNGILGVGIVGMSQDKGTPGKINQQSSPKPANNNFPPKAKNTDTDPFVIRVKDISHLFKSMPSTPAKDPPPTKDTPPTKDESSKKKNKKNKKGSKTKNKNKQQETKKVQPKDKRQEQIDKKTEPSPQHTPPGVVTTPIVEQRVIELSDDEESEDENQQPLEGTNSNISKTSKETNTTEKQKPVNEYEGKGPEEIFFLEFEKGMSRLVKEMWMCEK